MPDSLAISMTQLCLTPCKTNTSRLLHKSRTHIVFTAPEPAKPVGRRAEWPEVGGRVLQEERPASRLDKRHVTHYIRCMIRTFADRETQRLYTTGQSRRLPPTLLRRAVRRLEYIDLAGTLTDLSVPPSNRLHALKGDRAGLHSISINDQWRICFRFIDGDAYDVEITDYH